MAPKKMFVIEDLEEVSARNVGSTMDSSAVVVGEDDNGAGRQGLVAGVDLYFRVLQDTVKVWSWSEYHAMFQRMQILIFDISEKEILLKQHHEVLDRISVLPPDIVTLIQVFCDLVPQVIAEFKLTLAKIRSLKENVHQIMCDVCHVFKTDVDGAVLDSSHVLTPEKTVARVPRLFIPQNSNSDRHLKKKVKQEELAVCGFLPSPSVVSGAQSVVSRRQKFFGAMGKVEAIRILQRHGSDPETPTRKTDLVFGQRANVYLRYVTYRNAYELLWRDRKKVVKRVLRVLCSDLRGSHATAKRVALQLKAVVEEAGDSSDYEFLGRLRYRFIQDALEDMRAEGSAVGTTAASVVEQQSVVMGECDVNTVSPLGKEEEVELFTKVHEKILDCVECQDFDGTAIRAVRPTASSVVEQQSIVKAACDGNSMLPLSKEEGSELFVKFQEKILDCVACQDFDGAASYHTALEEARKKIAGAVSFLSDVGLAAGTVQATGREVGMCTRFAGRVGRHVGKGKVSLPVQLQGLLDKEDFTGVVLFKNKIINMKVEQEKMIARKDFMGAILLEEEFDGVSGDSVPVGHVAFLGV